MDLTNIKELLVDGIKLVELYINGVLVWMAKTFTNQVPISTDTDGSIYNGGLGYKNGYRVRSGGAEAASNYGSCTGYIPVKGGDVVRLSGWDFSYQMNENAINVSDIDYTNIGQFTMLPAQYGIFLTSSYKDYGYTSIVEETTGVWKWVVPPTASGAAYIRITGKTDLNGSTMIVTVNEEIT